MSCFDTLKYIIQELIKENSKLDLESTETTERYLNEVNELHEKKVIIDSLIKHLAFEISYTLENAFTKLQIPGLDSLFYSKKISGNLTSTVIAMETLTKILNFKSDVSKNTLEHILSSFKRKAESYLNHPMIRQYITQDESFQLFILRIINTVKNVLLWSYVFLEHQV